MAFRNLIPSTFPFVKNNPKDTGGRLEGGSTEVGDASSQHASQSDPASSTPIPDNILAFRTITSILSQIQQEMPFTVSNPKQGMLSREERYQLRLLNAFSIMAVIDHQIVAAILKRNLSDRQEPPPPPTTLVSQMAGLYETASRQVSLFVERLTLVQNNRRDDKNDASRTPFSIPTIPDVQIRDIDSNAPLTEYLQRCWPPKGRLKLNVHLSTLSKLLVYQPDRISPQLFHKRVLYYTVAASYNKIYNRLSHPKLSMPYMNTLMAIKDVTFRPVSMPQNAEPTPIQQDEWRSDGLFLGSLHKAGLKIKTPFLSRLATDVKNHKRKPSELYTAETCNEFHEVLKALLAKFLLSMETLASLINGPKGDPKPPKIIRPKVSRATKRVKSTSGSGPSESNPPVPDDIPPREITEQMSTFLSQAVWLGSCLFRIAHGSAIRLHLEAIEPELKSHHKHALTKLDPSTRSDIDKADEEELVDKADDEELEAVQPNTIEDGAPVPLWKSHRDWLRLIFIQFQSSETVSSHVLDHPHSQPMDIRLVVPPEDRLLDEKLLPWTTLLDKDSPFFPTSAADTSSMVRSNDSIIKFLSSGIETAPERRDSDHHQITDTTTPQLLGELCQYLASIAINSASKVDESTGQADAHGWAKQCKVILGLLLPPGTDLNDKTLNEIKTKKYKLAFTDAIRDNTEEINSLLQELDNNANFFHFLKRLDNNFMGSLHCEACLASLIVPNSEHTDDKTVGIQDLMNFDRIIGVLKRCCPACQHLLSLITQPGQRFATQGSHKTVSACTLPVWLPAKIVDSMNMDFGQQLRHELVRRMGSNGNWRKRTNSTGLGGRSSLDSYRGNSIQDDTELRSEEEMHESHFPAHGQRPNL